jgi:transposase
MPIVNALLARLGIDQRLDLAVVADPRSRIPPSATLGALLRNIIEARTPLYALGEWASERDPDGIGLGGGSLGVFNDDRVGRALDRLFDADRATLCTEIVVAAIRGFGIALDELHNDSTSLTFHGRYAAATGQRIRGQQTAKITHGHNKDYRPDLKQLLWILTVAADGAVPVHYRVEDGNTSDVVSHIGIWDLLVQLADRPDFLYVADSKLCTRENMGHIAARGGRFLTVLPRSRKEDPDFRHWVIDHQPNWVEARSAGTLPDGTIDAYLVSEAPWPSAEGYRVIWVLSTSEARRDADTRRARIKKAGQRLDEMANRLSGPKPRIRTRAAVDQAARAILHETAAERYMDIALEEVVEPHFRQERRGRPGKDTLYQRSDSTRVKLSWAVRADVVAAEAHSDGMFPLISNCRDLGLAELLDHYKYQPCLERRHQQLKSGLAVVPMWLKNVARIEAILLLYFIALLMRALIERQVRQQMTDEDLAAIPLYPEDRDCSSPSAERILAIFSRLQRHQLIANGKVVQTFEPRLTPTQRRVLNLLGLSPTIYRTPT